MSLIRKHGAVLQAWACLDLVMYTFCISFFSYFFYVLLCTCACSRVMLRQLKWTSAWTNERLNKQRQMWKSDAVQRHNIKSS